MKPLCASILPECRSPPRGLAKARPCSRASRRQRIALDTLTPKWAAAARQLRPPSIAATTLSRRSCESVRAIHAGLLTPARSLNHNAAAKGIPAESVRVETALNVLFCQELPFGISRAYDGFVPNSAFRPTGKNVRFEAIIGDALWPIWGGKMARRFTFWNSANGNCRCATAYKRASALSRIPRNFGVSACSAGSHGACRARSK